MEPIRIRCLHCNGRLVIRTPELLGRSVECPRCKKAISIPASNSPSLKAWAHSNPVLPPSFDSVAVTKVQDSFESKTVALPDVYADSPSSPSDEIASPELEFPDWEELSTFERVSPKLVAPETSQLTQAEWVNPNTSKSRLVLLVVTTGLIVTLIALSIFFLFVKSFSDGSPPLAKKTLTLNEPLALAPDSPIVADATNEAPINVSAKAEASASGSGENPLLPPTDSPVDKPIDKMPTANQTVPTGGQVPDVGGPEARGPELPRNLISGLTLGSESVEPNKTPLANTEVLEKTREQDMTAPAGLKQFAPVFDLGSAIPLSDASTTEKPLPEFEGGGGIVDLGTITHPPSIESPSWNDVKDTPILKFKAEKKSLSQVLLVFGQLASSGLGWDTQSLRWTTVNPSRIVSVQAVDSTLERELQKLIASVPVELQIVAPEENISKRFLLAPIDAEIADRLPTDWTISDLALDDRSLDQWTRLLRTLFPAAKETWKMQNKVLTWNDNRSIVQQASIAVFLDQARLAMGLPTKSGFANRTPVSSLDANMRTAWMEPTVAYEQALEQLNKRATSTLTEQMSAPAMLDMAATECELDLLMDWPSLYSHGFSHAAISLSLLKGRSWPAIAKRTMDQYDLVAIVDGPQRLILSTLKQQRQWSRTMILALKTGETIESVGESFRSLSPTDSQGRSSLLVSPLPYREGLKKQEPKDTTPSPELVVIRYCPPNTKQLQRSEIRRALRVVSKVPEEDR